MHKKHRLLIHCKEATLLATKKEFEALSGVQKTKLMVHLLFCKYCKRFIVQSNRIALAARQSKERLFNKPTYFLSEDAKLRLQSQIDALNESKH
jgi:hypothetical protein